MIGLEVTELVFLLLLGIVYDFVGTEITGTVGVATGVFAAPSTFVVVTYSGGEVVAGGCFYLWK